MVRKQEPSGTQQAPPAGQGFGSQVVPSPRYVPNVQPCALVTRHPPPGTQHAPVGPEAQGFGEQVVPGPLKVPCEMAQVSEVSRAQNPPVKQQAPSVPVLQGFGSHPIPSPS